MKKMFFLLGLASVLATSCVTKKKFVALQKDLDLARLENKTSNTDLARLAREISACEQEKGRLKTDLAAAQNASTMRQEQVNDLKTQVEDFKKVRDQQMTQVGDLTVLSQSANANINKTLAQLEKKDKYIYLLQNAKSKADSLNLALSVNLKTVLKDGVEDSDVEIKVDKTVVFVNLSDKMLFQSGSSNLTSKANEVLGKIAKIVESRPDLEVMVEGYTDNVPIKNDCLADNWDLSVKRSTAVVRVLQTDYKINPNRLIAAGRGEWNALATNATAEGRSTNRRTRIIILPKLDQFYDLLNPANVPK